MTPFLVWYGHAPAGAPQRTVSGLALVRRAVLSAQAQGFRTIVVAVRGSDVTAVRAAFFRDRRIQADVTVLEASARPLAAVEHVLPPGEPEVVVAFGDRVWVPSVLGELRAPLGEAVDARLLVAGGTGDQSPSGLVRIRAAALERLHLVHDLGPADVEAAVADAARLERRVVGLRWRRVQRPDDVRDAETLLLRALLKPADGIVARNINRRISTTLSRYLARRAITPNMVSAVVLLLGLCAGPFAALGTYLGLALGGLCYYVSSVLDGCDGELARLKYLSSPLGVWVDTIVDDLVGLSFLGGLYFGLSRWLHPWWFWVGVVVVGCYVLTILPRYWLFVTKVGVGDHQKLAADTRPKEAHGLALMFLVLRENIFRIDFLTFSAMVTCVTAVPFVFAACYAVGSVAGLIDTIATMARFVGKPSIARA
jgi:phosphatidylglycerophosphate synthase